MTKRRRGVAAALGGLALAAAVAPSATAAPDAGRIELSVVGAPQATTLFGDVILVPGHAQTRSLQVTNVGDLPGTLVIEVVDATLTGSPATYFDHLTVNDVPATVLDGVATAIAPTRTLAAGESVTVPVSLAFDVDNEQPDPGSVFSFAVRATLTGETPVDPAPTPAAPTAKEPAATQAATGGALEMSRTELLWAAGAMASGGLVALVAALRRRRDRGPA